MVIEEKNISDIETLMFFPTPLLIRGAFYHSETTSSSLPLLQNIASTELSQTILLTEDFMYLKSISPDSLEDLKTIALAEIDDYVATPQTVQIAPEENTVNKIRIILKTIIAPFLQKDGGDIEFVNLDNGTVKVHFLGKCHGCPYAEKTLKNRVEKNLIRYIPEIREALLV